MEHSIYKYTWLINTSCNLASLIMHLEKYLKLPFSECNIWPEIIGFFISVDSNHGGWLGKKMENSKATLM